MSYVPGTTKWGSDPTIGTPGGNVTWSVSADYFDALTVSSGSKPEFDQALINAFDEWESVASIEFTFIPNNAGAQIYLDSSNLGAGVAGLASIATAGFPSLTDVDVFFATGITWSPTVFYSVALHEIGHAIGLEHVNDTSEIMNPTIFATELGNGDIAAAQYLYGRDDDDVDWADAEQVESDEPDRSGDSSGGGGGGAIAALLGLLALLFGLVPGAGLALAAGKLAEDEEDGDGTADDTVALPDMDFANFLPTIPVREEHVVYLDQSEEEADDEMPFLL